MSYGEKHNFSKFSLLLQESFLYVEKMKLSPDITESLGYLTNCMYCPEIQQLAHFIFLLNKKMATFGLSVFICKSVLF